MNKTKRFLIAGAAMALLGMSACALNPNGSGGKVVDPTIIDTAQTTAQTVCGFLPLAATVLDILALANPVLATGEAIGTAICKSVMASSPAASAARVARAAPPVPATVSGVPIQGRFVR